VWRTTNQSHYHYSFSVIAAQGLEGNEMNKTIILVRDWMSSPVQVVSPDMPVGDAYNIMMQKGIRRLPVVENGKVTGIVTLGDLREARPSPANSLSIYELNYLLAKLSVGQVMTHNPYCVSADTNIPDAARIMLERKVSGLPVVDEHRRAVGIITESDIFRMLIDQWDYFTTQHVDPGFVASLIAEQSSR
jgi:acetoin utilization protein AcuB